MRTLAALAVVLLLAGCAGTSSPSSPSTQATTASTTGSPSSTATATATASSSTSASQAPAAPRTYTVNITGNQFVGGTLTIHAGDTVHWVHKDGTTPHSVKADDGSFDSDGGLPCPGPGCMTSQVHSTYDHTFPAAGTFAYHCEVHPTSMKNTITVV